MVLGEVGLRKTKSKEDENITDLVRVGNDYR